MRPYTIRQQEGEIASPLMGEDEGEGLKHNPELPAMHNDRRMKQIAPTQIDVRRRGTRFARTAEEEMAP